MNRILKVDCSLGLLACSWAIFLLLFIPGASGAPLLMDSFDYPGGGASIDGQAGGTGWDGAWSVRVHEELTGGATVETGSLSFGSYPTFGNRVSITANSSTAPASLRNVSLDRKSGVTVGSVGGEMWQSFLWRRVDNTFNGYDTNFNVGDGVQDDFRVKTNFEMRIRPKRENIDGLQLRYFDHSLGEEIESPDINDGDTFLFVARFQDLGNTNPITGPLRMAQLWVLDVTGYEAVKAGSTLYAEAVQINNAQHGSDEETMLNAGDVIGIAHLYYNRAAAFGDEFTTEWDEMRWGDSIDDVLPGFTNANIGVVPEPSTMLLGSLAAFFCVGGGRKAG